MSCTAVYVQSDTTGGCYSYTNRLTAQSLPINNSLLLIEIYDR